MEQRPILPSSYSAAASTLQEQITELLPPGWPGDIPLARITTCGQFTLEVLQELCTSSDGLPSPVYGPPILPRNGAATALNLLKLLISQPGRVATKDWLTDQLGGMTRKGRSQEEEAWIALARPDNSISHLRAMLSPTALHPAFDARNRQALGRLLVEYVKPTVQSGCGYRLMGAPLIWIDVEALHEHVQQACQGEAQGHDALTHWKAAYEISNRGPFLAEGRYSDWAVARREEVDGDLWQSVQALWREAMKQGEAGEEEALRLLREYWVSHPEREDAFRPLVELLGKRGDYQRAEQYYRMLCDALDQQGREPGSRIREAMALLQQHQLHGTQEHQRFLIHTTKIDDEKRDSKISQLLCVDESNSRSTVSWTPHGQPSNRELLKEMIDRNFPQDVTYNLLSSNIKTMNFRDEWQYVVNNLVAETKKGLRAMVFDVELTRWWNSIAGQAYMMTNLNLLKNRVSIKRIFLLNSLDVRLRMNALLNAYVHHKMGIDVKICTAPGFQNSLPFKPDMFSVHDKQFVTLYYFSSEKSITNILLEDKHITDFCSFYDELFLDDRLCTDIESVLVRTNYGEGFWASAKMQLKLLQRLEKVESVVELAKNTWM